MKQQVMITTELNKCPFYQWFRIVDDKRVDTITGNSYFIGKHVMLLPGEETTNIVVAETPGDFLPFGRADEITVVEAQSGESITIK